MGPCCHSKCKGKKRCLISGRWIDYHDYGAQFDGEQSPVQGQPGQVVDEGENKPKNPATKADYKKLALALNKGIPKDTDLAKASVMSNRPASKDEGVLSNMRRRLKRYMKNPPKGVNLKRIPKADKQADKYGPHNVFDTPSSQQGNEVSSIQRLSRMSKDDPAAFKAIRKNARLLGSRSDARVRVQKKKLAVISRSDASLRDKLKRAKEVGYREEPKETSRITRRKHSTEESVQRERSSDLILAAIAKMYNEGS